MLKPKRNITDRILKLKDAQVIELSKGHYKHIPRHENGDSDFQVNEYVTPKGKIGLEFVTYTIENGKEYLKIEATGVEKSSREHDWELFEGIDAGT